MKQVIQKEIAYRGYAKVEKWQVQGPGEQIRPVELLRRGKSVAVLPYDPELKQVLLVAQFRPGAIESSDLHAFRDELGLRELVAGMIDAGETPELAAVREMQEETGLTACQDELQRVGCFYLSPGISDETTTVFLLKTNLSDIDTENFGGLAEEGEQIQKLLISFDELSEYLHADEGISVTLALAARTLLCQL